MFSLISATKASQNADSCVPVFFFIAGFSRLWPAQTCRNHEVHSWCIGCVQRPLQALQPRGATHHCSWHQLRQTGKDTKLTLLFSEDTHQLGASIIYLPILTLLIKADDLPPYAPQSRKLILYTCPPAQAPLSICVC